MARIRILVSLTTNDNDYQIEQAQSAEQAANRLGVTAEIIYADNDAINQSTQILRAIQADPADRPSAIEPGEDNQLDRGRRGALHRHLVGHPEAGAREHSGTARALAHVSRRSADEFTVSRADELVTISILCPLVETAIPSNCGAWGAVADGQPASGIGRQLRARPHAAPHARPVHDDRHTGDRV